MATLTTDSHLAGGQVPTGGDQRGPYLYGTCGQVDAFRPGIPGGTGETFDWGLIPGARSQPLVLSGGLTAGNVAAGMERVRPWAVDVSSGVESTPGVKDLGLIARFIDAVRRADEQRDATYEYRQGNKSAA